MICNLHFITTIHITMHTLLHMRFIPHHLTVLFFIHASILSLVPIPHVSAQSTDGQNPIIIDLLVVIMP